MFYLTLLGLVLVGISSLAARSLKSFSRHDLEELCEKRKTTEKFNRILKEYERTAASVGMFRVLCTSAVLICAVFWLDPTLSARLFANWENIAILAGAVVGLLAVEIWLPRALSRLWGTGFVYHTWSIWRFLAVLFYPLDLADRFVDVFFHRLAGKQHDTDGEEAFEDEIRTIVTEGHREGLLEEDAREMIESVMELSDFTVSEIMTPRTDMVSIPTSLSWDDMLKEVVSSAHSRIPVYGENRDDILGVLHAKDLLGELAVKSSDQRRPWTQLVKEPLFVPETKPVDTLLQEFQNLKPKSNGNGSTDDASSKAKPHLAIVLDEYGGVSGIVTLEDILEEIVGEIVDEHDDIVEFEDIFEIDANTFEALGKVRIDDLNEHLGAELPEEEDYDTVAGFIFSTLGHVPEVGERVDYEKDGKTIRFTVLEATKRRIEKVRVERLRGESA